MKFISTLIQLLRFLFFKKGDFDLSSLAEDGGDIKMEEWNEPQLPSIDEPVSTTINPMAPSHYHWILDPGHNPATLGKQAPYPIDGVFYKEWEFNHDVARKVSTLLAQKGIDHSLTVGDEHIESNYQDLVRRSKYALSLHPGKAKRFVSIHTNAAKGGEKDWVKNAHGTETFIHPNATVASRNMATIFQRNLVAGLGTHDRGVKTANFHVLRETKGIPACLLEIDFHTKESVAKELLKQEYRWKVANIIVQSIIEYEQL